jgi:hypothetical protein
MCYLLLESIFIYGNLNDKTNILIYTTDQYKNILKQSHLINDKILFEINNTYINVDSACKARLDIFNFQFIKNYKKILYLDVDIIIKGDINKVFDIINDDIIYVLEEGNIDSDSDYWGKTLFNDEVNNYEDKTAFTSGILLFNNCEKIKNIFTIIKKDIITRVHAFHDQPYIVYNFFKYNLYNNKILKKYAINNDHNIYSDKVIHHFPGGPGSYQHKIVYMNTFLNNIKDITIDTIIENTKKYINENLISIIINSGELLEGNIFMYHNTFNYADIFINKIKNISNVILNNNIKNILEIGFNAGFSSLLMLLTNKNINITCIDIAEHKYTIQCYNKIKETFGDRINLIIGDSKEILKQINNIYELIHIDGSHTTIDAENDIINIYKLLKHGTILIMDDYNFPNIYELWNKYILLYNLKSLDINLYDTQYSDIKYITLEF